MWAILLGYVSHVLLVISSSANFYIYCIIGASLRTQLVTSIAATSGLCCRCCKWPCLPSFQALVYCCQY